MTPKQVNYLLGAIAMLVLPPLLARSLSGAFTELRFLTLGLAICTAMAAISLNLLMGYAGQISLGHAALVGIGAFTSALVTTRGPELPMPAGILAAGAVAGAFAFILGLPALRLRGLYLAVVTIAFGLTVEQSLLRWKPITRGSAGLTVDRFLFGNLELRNNGDYIALLLFVFLLIWILDRNVVASKLGRALHAIREDELVAQSFGIDVARYKLTAFVLSGVIAGISGALLGHLIGHVTSESFPYRVSLLLVVMVVVGGLGSRAWVTVAALFFAFLPRLFATDALRFMTGWDQVLGAFMLIFTMARHPGGLAGAIREAREKAEEKRLREVGAEEEEEVRIPRLPSLERPSHLPERPSLSAGEPVLETASVSVTFGGLQALDDVALQVPEGLIVGLIGPNGAGKTTMFNAISGFIRHEGRIRFLGKEVQDLAPHERAQLGMGRTFQLIGLAKNLSVLENFQLAQHGSADYGLMHALGHLKKGRSIEAELKQRGLAAIEALGFERFVETPVKNLSHGQQRLVELGCALVTAPELLLLDEPSAGMAPGAVENLALRLKEIRDQLGRTVLLIEHNIPLVLEVCDYIYVLNFGKILAQGSTQEIAAHPDVIAAYFGESETTAIPDPQAVYT